ncbi:MAG: CDP-2,3-bis-(O-geranylgeranyl)-sn-glycerol synthase [Halobacteria archaeon]|nr:CDP-2,3-bis-(O-geranylgeranyl)-sn-glycerol synthase [Halobacteria archaeon]
MIQPILETAVTAVWLMLPAYIPNNAAVIFGGGRRIDAGKEWGGRRILGDGKTWRGSVGGFVSGLVVALVLNLVSASGVPEFSIGAAVTLPLGAVLGDIGASFVKRRLGRERGESFPLLDQLDFVAGAWGLTAVFDTDWFLRLFTAEIIIAVLIITPLLHLTVNVVGYKIGVKNEPW